MKAMATLRHRTARKFIRKITLSSKPFACYSASVGTDGDIARYLSNRQEELDSAAEYRAMAESEKDPRLSSIYSNLARTEEKHAAFWESRIAQAGQPVPPRRVSF